MLLASEGADYPHRTSWICLSCGCEVCDEPDGTEHDVIRERFLPEQGLMVETLPLRS